MISPKRRMRIMENKLNIQIDKCGRHGGAKVTLEELTVWQFSVMQYVYDNNNEKTRIDIYKYMNEQYSLDTDIANIVVQQLVDKEYISSMIEEEDVMVPTVRITEKGAEVFKEHLHKMTAVKEGILKCLNDDEKVMLHRVMRKLKQTYLKDNI